MNGQFRLGLWHSHTDNANKFSMIANENNNPITNDNKKPLTNVRNRNVANNNKNDV